MLGDRLRNFGVSFRGDDVLGATGPECSSSVTSMRGRVSTIVIFAASLAAPGIARADVLVSRPTPSIRCGETIKTGVWYRDFPLRGRRTATIAIRSSSGALLWHRDVTATTSWRYFRYSPGCGRHYRVRYETSSGTTTFRVWVRKRD